MAAVMGRSKDERRSKKDKAGRDALRDVKRSHARPLPSESKGAKAARADDDELSSASDDERHHRKRRRAVRR